MRRISAPPSRLMLVVPAKKFDIASSAGQRLQREKQWERETGPQVKVSKKMESGGPSHGSCCRESKDLRFVDGAR